MVTANVVLRWGANSSGFEGPVRGRGKRGEREGRRERKGRKVTEGTGEKPSKLISGYGLGVPATCARHTFELSDCCSAADCWKTIAVRWDICCLWVGFMDRT